MTKNGVTLGAAAKWFALAVLCCGVASCTTTSSGKSKKTKTKEYFSESEYGVKASPRVATGNVPKGGGRYLVGRPYKVRGKTYVPRENPNYDKVGLASWYGSAFHGRKTANGEVYDQYTISAAHPTMPLPSYARVTNLDNGSSIVVRVNDRGPFHQGRIIDLSSKTADLLDMKHSGTAKVRVQYVGPARMDGHDMPTLMASFSRKGDRIPQVGPDGILAQGVMLASNTAAPAGEFPAAPVLAAPSAASSATAFNAAPVMDASSAFQQVLLLPDTGPELIERPIESPESGQTSQVSAYVEATTAISATAFDAILVRDDRLTPQTIRAYAAKRSVSGN